MNYLEKLTPSDEEKDIINNWKYTDKVYISCVCTTYNQERYIADTVNGMLAQVSDYKFEIIIHDDASSDGTRDILLKFKEKYPSIIVLILQDENQYSKGKKISLLAVEYAVGEYVAFCEGDDFWIDENKLKKQYSLIKNSDCDICFTNAYMEYSDGKRIKFINSKKHSNKCSISEVVRSGGGGMPTASIMIKSDIFRTVPDWFSSAPVGDYFIQILGSLRNGAVFLNDITVVYRVGAVGSWTINRIKVSDNKLKMESEAYVNIFDKLKSSGVSRCDADYAVANELYNLAACCVKKRSFILASRMISDSWGKCYFVSYKQFLLYCLSRLYLFFFRF